MPPDFNDNGEPLVKPAGWAHSRVERPAVAPEAPSTSGKPPWREAMPETAAAVPAAEDEPLVQREPGEVEDDPELQASSAAAPETAAEAPAAPAQSRERSYHVVKRDDLTNYTVDIARRLLGPENTNLSSRETLRFGTNGSVSVEVEKGIWYDHENALGGGPVQLIAHIKGMLPAVAAEWLESEFGIEIERDGGKRVVATYDYRDEDGRLLFQKVRYDPKDFRQRRPDGVGGWIWNINGVPRVLYHLSELRARPNETIYFNEGEKDCDNGSDKLGLLTTCNPEGGSKTRTGKPGKWRPEYSEELRGRDVVVIPDNDDVGRAHARTIANKLTAAACRVRILTLPGLPPKGDLSNWIAAGGTREALEALLAGDAAPEHVTAEPAAPERAERPSGNPDWLKRTPTVEEIEPREIKLRWYRDLELQRDDVTLVGGFIDRGTLIILVGKPGTSKTFLAVDLSLHIAAGKEWFGRKVEQGGVVYVAAEAGERIINRIVAYKQHHNEHGDLPFAVVTSTVNLLDEAGDTGELIAKIQAAAASIGQPIAMVIIDTLSRVMPGGDENSSQDMTALVRNMDAIREATTAAVFVVHHHGKDEMRGARGHSSLIAAVDTELTIDRPEGATVTMIRATKQRDMAEGDPIAYRLHVVELGDDSSGNALTSCVIEPVDELPTRAAKAVRLPDSAKLALDQLRNCIAVGHGGPVPASNHVPAGVTGITEDEWKRYLKLADVCGGNNARQEYRRARDRLKTAGYIGHWGEWVWLVGGTKSKTP